MSQKKKTTAQSKRPRKAPSNQTGGTAWGKKAAAAISGKMQSADVKKLILLNFPYIIAFYMVEKAAWLYRHCNGDTIVDRLMVLFMNFGLAYKSYLPSVHPFDLLVGLIGAAALKAVIYFKGKNAKKYRQGEEYGSARWGNAKDIEPFIDPVFENNVLLTQTERLMMSGRPKHPKYARNKNVIVIGGSGSGKTRFFVKPNLMQMPEKVSYVCTDPKGTIIIECGKMLSDAGYKIKVLNTINFKKSMHRISKEMADSVKAIQSSKTAEEISLNVGDYNAKVIGVQDYYCIATRVNLNFSDIAHPINGQLLHRIDGIKKQGEIKNRYLRKRYGKSKQMRWIGETPLVPLAYVQFKIPMRKNRKINLYTPEGRAEIHDNLRIDVNSMLWLMRHPISTESVRYNDNRVSLYAGQDGKCAITGKKLDVQTCICYRKTNDCKKGNDSYQNLLLLSLQGLAIVSSEDMMSVVALVKEYSLNAKVITKVNKLRATAGLPLLAAK